MVQHAVPSLIELPTEVLTLVISSCATSRDMVATALTCHCVYNIAEPLLFQRQILKNDYYIAFWAARGNHVATLRRLSLFFQPEDHGFNISWYWRGKEAYHRGALDNATRRRLSWFGTPLHEAAEAGAIDAMQFMLSYGADINAQSLCFSDGPSGLDEYRWYIDFGDRVSFEPRPLVGFTPLITAILFKQTHISEMLLRLGASVEILWIGNGEVCGTTALHYAAALGDVAVVKMLLEGGHSEPDARDGAGYPPLIWASLHENGHLALKTLVDAGTDINCVVPSGLAPGYRHSMVTTLTKRGHPEAAARLVALGAATHVEEESLVQ
ncbi:ankyrin repeat-containing domain protein [Ilyonectria sp. MPI-CAGE-AT-0026]|nr:ankyrin repeat-containing domain protein [Ilyonectria sp. MPI-CAGE-AT-0026]